MAESSNVRLVRCPKCENLLPELPDYSVYQCGGCGAVLRAKKTELDGDMGLAERPAHAIPGVLAHKSENFLVEPKKLPEKSVSTLESGEGTVSDSDGSTGAVAESYDNVSKKTAETCGGVESAEKCINQQLKNGSLKSNDAAQVEEVNGSLCTNNKSIRQKAKEKPEKDGIGKLSRGEYEYQGVRFHPRNPGGEGTSRYYAIDDHRSTRNLTEPGISSGAEYARPNREELLRKLDELKEQLNQSCAVNTSKFKETEPLEPPKMFNLAQDPYADPDGRFHDQLSSYGRRSRQFCEDGSRPRHYDHYHDEPFSAVDRYGNYGLMAVQDLSHGTSGYEHSSDPHFLCSRPIPRRILAYPPQNPRSHSYLRGQHRNPEPDLFEPDPLMDNHFPCSCYHCYHKQIQIPASAYRRYSLGTNKPLPCHHENYRVFPPQGGGGYGSRINHCRSYIGSYEPNPPSNTRWPNDLDIELSEIPQSRPSRVAALSSRGRPIRPVAGGAPFITCHNCFELLELPKKISSHLDKATQWKICCGRCSSLISFRMVDEKLVPIDVLPLKKNLMMKDALESSGEELMHDKPYDPHSGMRRDNAGFHSEEFDNNSPIICDDFQSVDKEHVSSRRIHGSKSEELRNFQLLSSSTTSEDEDIHGNLVVLNGVVKNGSDELPMDAGVLSMPSPSSPLQEHFDFSSRGRRAVNNRCGKGSLSSRSDQERIIVAGKTAALRQNSLQESLATEMESSLNDYTNAAVSLDTSKEEDHQPKGKRGGVDSFFAGIIKKSFRNTHAGDGRKRNITVNGHVIPDRSLKKAEKLAGPVCPGQYWYDYRAGFWGVMGGPCLGILPPHIEEFNYPLPEKCAGGDTNVFVNGRELHQKDLELLASRGLPTTSHRSYIIEISGRVLDEDSGEELDGLGKLAPTIEKVKHGFGMRDLSASAHCTS